MDWGKQYLNVVKDWAELQVKTGQGWVEAVQATDKFDPGLIWGKSIDACQASAQGTLDAEVAGSRIWFEGVAAMEGLPKEVAGMVQQMQGFNKQVTGMQQEFVNAWFELLKQTKFSEFPFAYFKEQPVKLKVAAKA